MMSLSANYRPFLRCFQGQPESRFCVIKFGRDVTVDDGGNYVMFHELNVRIKIKINKISYNPGTEPTAQQMLSKCKSLQF